MLQSTSSRILTLFAMGNLFRRVAVPIAGRFGFDYPAGDDARVSAHLEHCEIAVQACTGDVLTSCRALSANEHGVRHFTLMIDLKRRLNEPIVLELLSLSIGNPTPEKTEQMCQRYRRDPDWHIMGYEWNGLIVGCIGMEISGLTQGLIRCISVAPSIRQQGIGRAMLQEIATVNGLTRVIAETDRTAVGFYRQCGFQIESLGERYPGVERFRCVKDL